MKTTPVKPPSERRSHGGRPPLPEPLAGWLIFLLISAAVGIASIETMKFIMSSQVFERRGKLIDANAATHVLTVQNSESGGRNTYTWTDRTEFTSGDKKAGPEVLSLGAEVIVYYRGSFSVSHAADRIKVIERPPSR